MRMLITCLAALSLAGAAAGDEAMPDISRWNCEGIVKLVCSDGSPGVMRNFVIEYRNPADNSPRLRIWGVLEKKADAVITSVTCGYYKREGVAWRLLERKTFRQPAISGGKPILLFMKNSLFGNEFFAYAQASGGVTLVPVLEFGE